MTFERESPGGTDVSVIDHADVAQVEQPPATESSTETTPQGVLLSFLERPYKELKEQPIDQVYEYEQGLVEAMRTNQFSASTFADTSHRFPPPLQKKLAKMPASELRQHVLDHIVNLRRMCRERLAREQREFEVRERERLAFEAEQERQRVLREQADLADAERREAQELLARADAYGEEQYAAWNGQRTPLDGHGRPRALFEDDQMVVDTVEARARQQASEGQTFHEQTKRYERGFARWLVEHDVLGADVSIDAHPVTNFDDITKHIDVGVRHTIPGVQRSLGIDFSVASSDTELARKIRNSVNHPFKRISYSTPHFPGGMEFINFVVTLDRKRAERLLRFSNFLGVRDIDHPIHATMEKKFVRTITQHADTDILQYTVIEELLAQAEAQREELQRRQVSAEYLTDHEVLISFFTQLLDQRKHLHERAQVEVTDPAVQRVYRTRDREFIRASQSNRAAA